jgi:putative FmdB family regulatory protein
MPTYSYHCPLCQDTVTVVKSIHSSETEECTNCKVPLVKNYFAPPVSFKGGGWAHKE